MTQFAKILKTEMAELWQAYSVIIKHNYPVHFNQFRSMNFENRCVNYAAVIATEHLPAILKTYRNQMKNYPFETMPATF